MSRINLIASLLALALGATATASAAPAAAGPAPADFSAPGPCTSQRYEKLTVLPPSAGCKLNECAFKLLVTRPTAGAAGGACPQGPYPVVWFFSGFASRAGWYSYLADRVASYGYSVVQYDVQALITTDAQDLGFLGPIRKLLEGGSKEPGGPLAGALDFSQQATAGHSRGGKLAALHLAKSPAIIKTSVLIDPVDNTMFSPESDSYPSAAKALAALNPRKTAAVIGVGVPSACNPTEANYQTFYSQLAPGSWLEVLPGATHMDFVVPLGGLLPMPPVCGTGNGTAAAARDDAAAFTVAWLQQAFRGESAAAYKDSVKREGPSQATLITKAV